MPHTKTQKLTLPNPGGEALLTSCTKDRTLTPELIQHLRKVVETFRGTRKIYIPSIRDDVAAILILRSSLGEGGLSISDELHVVWGDKVIAESWPCRVAGGACGEGCQSHFVEFSKVRIEGDTVEVDLQMPGLGTQINTRTFDFSQHPGETVKHLLEQPPFAQQSLRPPCP